jgi:two-component system, NarL family, nitrate/nitrite response regulator NarL
VPTSSRRKGRVLLVDDHPLVVAGLRSELEQRGTVRVVGTAADGMEAIRLARELSPDLIIMDVALPGVDGVEATRLLRRTCPNAKVLGFSMHEGTRYARDMARAGAWGYVPKSAEPAEVLRAVEDILNGQQHFPQNATSASSVEGGLPPNLSRRELEVLTLIAEGHSNKEVASRLGIGVRTVETHRERVMRKLDVQGTAGLTKWAVSHGLVDPTR